MNRILILIPFFFFSLFIFVHAEEIYIYKHRNGNIVITNKEIPEEYKTKAQKGSSLKHEIPSEKPQRESVQAVQSTKTFNPKSIEKEKKRLEADLKRLKNQESTDSSSAAYYRFYIEAYENNLKLLEKDPESYFNKQEALEKEAAKLLRGHASPNKP